jgi:NTE family protein
VKYQNYFLIDGSASESVPAGRVRELGADRVLAVDVMRPIKTVKQPQNVIDILYRAEDITSHHLSILRLREADLIIRPKVKHLSWADFEKINEIIYSGEKAAAENIAAIKKLVESYSLLLKLKQKFKKLD